MAKKEKSTIATPGEKKPRRRITAKDRLDELNERIAKMGDKLDAVIQKRDELVEEIRRGAQEAMDLVASVETK